jgi:hypothetical protein
LTLKGRADLVVRHQSQAVSRWVVWRRIGAISQKTPASMPQQWRRMVGR